MRQIKFRAWDESRKKMYSGDPKWVDFKIESSGELTASNYNPKHELQTLPVMQFTGLKDANGVEIYEGDIIRYVEKSTIETITKPVVFIDGGFLIQESEFCDMPLGGLCSDENHEGSHIGFVIGNIHQNPELLK